MGAAPGGQGRTPCVTRRRHSQREDQTPWPQRRRDRGAPPAHPAALEIDPPIQKSLRLGPARAPLIILPSVSQAKKLQVYSRIDDHLRCGANHQIACFQQNCRSCQSENNLRDSFGAHTSVAYACHDGTLLAHELLLPSGTSRIDPHLSVNLLELLDR
jgi:hypothetical protein